MSTYLDIDSYHRLRDLFPNPASFEVCAEQISSWAAEPRIVARHGAVQSRSDKDFVQAISPIKVILPYTACTYTDKTGTVVNTHTARLQRIYIDIHGPRYNDNSLMNSIDNQTYKANFVLFREADDIIRDDADAPKWISFTSKQTQAMRYKRDDCLIIDILQERGFTINITDNAPPAAPDEDKQVYVCMEVTPYYRAGQFDQQQTSLTGNW